jgi:hypothetical protein
MVCAENLQKKSAAPVNSALHPVAMQTIMKLPKTAIQTRKESPSK